MAGSALFKKKSEGRNLGEGGSRGRGREGVDRESFLLNSRGEEGTFVPESRKTWTIGDYGSTIQDSETPESA